MHEDKECTKTAVEVQRQHHTKIDSAVKFVELNSFQTISTRRILMVPNFDKTAKLIKVRRQTAEGQWNIRIVISIRMKQKKND